MGGHRSPPSLTADKMLKVNGPIDMAEDDVDGEP